MNNKLRLVLIVFSYILDINIIAYINGQTKKFALPAIEKDVEGWLKTRYAQLKTFIKVDNTLIAYDRKTKKLVKTHCKKRDTNNLR